MKTLENTINFYLFNIFMLLNEDTSCEFQVRVEI